MYCCYCYRWIQPDAACMKESKLAQPLPVANMVTLHKVHTCGNIYNPIIIQACISFIWAIRHNEYFTFGTLRLFLKLILSIRLFHCGVDTFTLGEEIQSQSYDIYKINEVIMLTQHYLFFS